LIEKENLKIEILRYMQMYVNYHNREMKEK